MTTTQTDAILAMLRAGPITPLEALRDAGVFRLAARIKDLRDLGYVIDTETVTTASGKRIARYRLVERPRQLELLEVG